MGKQVFSDYREYKLLLVMRYGIIYRPFHILPRTPLLGIFATDILTYAQEMCIKQFPQHCLQQQQIGNIINIIVKEKVFK